MSLLPKGKGKESQIPCCALQVHRKRGKSKAVRLVSGPCCTGLQLRVLEFGKSNTSILCLITVGLGLFINWPACHAESDQLRSLGLGRWNL